MDTYEKKYKGALNWMREMYPGLHGATKEDAEHYFPELRESEDERIRKLLVWQVYRNIEDETNDLAGSVYDGIKGHDPDLEESIEDWKKCLNWLEKQKDHFRDDTKMVEKQDYSGLNDLERAIHRGFLSAGVENVPAAIIKETANECKRIANENANAEWSEEDEDKLYQVMETLLADKAVALRETPHCKALHEAYDDMLAWLKSLRPVSKESLQSHWKPSEEQMMALADTLEDMPEHYKPKCALESLKRDLEKLM